MTIHACALLLLASVIGGATPKPLFGGAGDSLTPKPRLGGGTEAPATRPADDRPLADAIQAEERAQKRAAEMTDRAVADLARILDALRDHRLSAAGDLAKVGGVHQELAAIEQQDLPRIEKSLYEARARADSPKTIDQHLTAASGDQQRVLVALRQMISRIESAVVVGALVQRAEQIWRDQVRLNGQTKPVLRDAFAKTVDDLPVALRDQLNRLQDEERRIGREIAMLTEELAGPPPQAEQGQPQLPPDQRAAMQRAREHIQKTDLVGLAGRTADDLAANRAQAAGGQATLEKELAAVVAMLRAAADGDAKLDPFDLLGPSLQDLAKKDKELRELLDKLQKMIKAAELLAKDAPRGQVLGIINMQDELKNMLVEIDRTMPAMDAELIARLKELLRQALEAFDRGDDALGRGGEGIEELIAELRVTLSNLNLAEMELQALLAALAALQSKGQGDYISRDTPAGIAFGNAFRFSGNMSGASGPGAVVGAAPRKSRELTDQDWGRLPPAMRQQLLEGIREAYPQDFEDLIELYFRNIAREANK